MTEPDAVASLLLLAQAALREAETWDYSGEVIDVPMYPCESDMHDALPASVVVALIERLQKAEAEREDLRTGLSWMLANWELLPMFTDSNAVQAELAHMEALVGRGSGLQEPTKADKEPQ